MWIYDETHFVSSFLITGYIDSKPYLTGWIYLLNLSHYFIYEGNLPLMSKNDELDNIIVTFQYQS